VLKSRFEVRTVGGIRIGADGLTRFRRFSIAVASVSRPVGYCLCIPLHRLGPTVQLPFERLSTRIPRTIQFDHAVLLAW
jgi:hypothetical protein